MFIKRFFALTLAAVFALALTVSAYSVTSVDSSLFNIAHFQFHNNDSVYSSLSNCKLVKTDRESDSSTKACRGVGGYNLQLEYGDVRESITVIGPDGKKHPLEFWNVISSAFSHVGEKAEWRVTKKNGKMVPNALIIRFTATEGAGDTPKPVSYLAVAKITPGKICVTDKIAPSRTANAEARRAADASAGKPCLEPPQ